MMTEETRSTMLPAVQGAQHRETPDGLSGPATHVDLAVGGMTCASCVARVERTLKRVPGVQEATLNLATERAAVAYDPTATTVADLIGAVEVAGYSAAPVSDERLDDAIDDAAGRRVELRSRRVTLAVGAVLSALVVALAMIPSLMDWPTPQAHNYLLTALALPVWLGVGWTFHRGALRNARHLTANMDTLISLGSSVAYLFSLVVTVALPGQTTYYDTAALIVTLIYVGKYLEAAARGRASAAISALARLQSRTDHVVRNGTERDLPVEKGPGDSATAGTINSAGLLRLRATRVGHDTALAGIIRLVEQPRGPRRPCSAWPTASPPSSSRSSWRWRS